MADEIETNMRSNYCVSIVWKNPKNRIYTLKDGSTGIRIRTQDLTKVKLVVAEDFIPTLFKEQYMKEEQQAQERKI